LAGLGAQTAEQIPLPAAAIRLPGAWLPARQHLVGVDQAGGRLRCLARQVQADAPAVSGLYHRALDLIRSEFAEQACQAFWKTAIEEQPSTAVAAELGMTAAAVRKAKSRILRRLKEEVGDLLA